VRIGVAIDLVLDAEMNLAQQLGSLAQRHLSEPDVYHMSLSRGHACAEHAAKLRPFLSDGAHAVTADTPTPSDPVGMLENGSPEDSGPVPATGLTLVEDLTAVYIAAHRAEIGWIVLQQAAKATRDAQLVSVTQACAAETEQTWKWLRTRIKDAAPQALATS
jgi:hypothetical protein